MDIHAMYQLVGECRDLGDDPQRWRQHLMAGLCRLLGAGVGNYHEGVWEPYRPSGVVTWGLENGFDSEAYVRMYQAFDREGLTINPMLLPFLAALDGGAGPGLTRSDLVSDAGWYRSPYYRDYHGAAGGDAILYCSLPLADASGQMIGMSLVRLIGEKDFSPKDRVFIREVFTLIMPLIGGPLASFGEPSPAKLPPRQGGTSLPFAGRRGQASRWPPRAEPVYGQRVYQADLSSLWSPNPVGAFGPVGLPELGRAVFLVRA